MEFWLLGPLEVTDGDRLLHLGGSKRRALLALLILNANEVVSTDRLAEELWGEGAPANAAGSIHNHISRLRKEIGPDVLATHRWGYVLRTDGDSIDLRRFERAITEAEALPAAERATRLAEALSLWRGPPLADLAFEPALARHIARLEEQRFAALEQRIDADLELGRHAELVGELEALVAASPLREHFRWQLILALYRSGRQAEGLEVYRETHRLLADELGLEPSPELRELERAVLRHDPALALPVVQVETVAADRTQRARSRARAAMIVTLAALGLAATGYALATADGGDPARAPLAAETTSRAPPQVTPVADRRLTQGSLVTAKHTAPKHNAAKRAAPKHTAPKHTAPKRAAPKRAPKPAAGMPAAHAVTTTSPAPTTTESPARPTPQPTPAKPAPRPTTTTRPTPATTTAPAVDARTPPTLADTRGWWFGGQQKDDVVVTHSGGGLTVAVHATAKDGFGAFAQTRCRLEGDFDAQVSFRLVDWSGADGIWLSLSASDLGGVNVYRTDAFGESYGTYIPPSGGTAVPAAGTAGSLRLVRHAGDITGFYNDGSNWVTIYSGPGPTAPTALGLGVFNLADVATFAGRPATVRFDSFTLNSGTLAC